MPLHRPRLCAGYSNFELRLHENSPEQQFEFVYGEMEGNGQYGSVGVQKGQGSYFTQYSCHTSVLSQGTQLTFTLLPCSTSTPMVTATLPGMLTSTSTPLQTATATCTPVSAASTTPTSCSIQFTDVPPGATFYPYIVCLACRGIITGYSDGTFRPGNNVTRGQAAKILANSASYADAIPSSRQTFNDVTPGNPFWLISSE